MPIHKEFNRSFFKKWSAGMAYILGFLFADGNIIKTKRNTYFTSLYTADQKLLISIKKRINSTHKISTIKSKSGVVYKIQIGSKELFDDLTKFGLVPHKVRRMKLPKIPRKYRGDFIRGYFDGDGNVWTGLINKNRTKTTSVILVSFTSANRDFLVDLFRLLKKEGLKGGSIYNVKSKKCSRLSFSTLDALKLSKIMYTMPYELFLMRKKLVFDEFMKMRL